ncbi:DNA cytosine methyltransferase [Candidatus Magnetominusculus dajiuhuensis]|uniref:DNA cytosine methyltransferase n=1 Tax=Candidatus Magnetominusculus dajiuhuensis TaxID=3137712 RepID=UPI003B43778F
MKPAAISIFSGCGGSDLGLVAAGFEVLMANDISKYACMVYKENIPDIEMVCGDIREMNTFPKADLLSGCYPCQGYSQGGARDIKREINSLYMEFHRVLTIVKPKAFIVENVSGMLRSNYKENLDNQLSCFKTAGYRIVGPTILNSYDYGVAQTRKRIFIAGVRNDIDVNYEFPSPTHGAGKLPHINQQDVLKDLPEWPEGEFYDLSFHWYYLSRNRRREWDKPSATILSNARHMPLHPLSPPLVKHGHDRWQFADDRPARRFSYREAALLQGFPRDFKFPEEGSLMQRYKAVGNAVPPPLFKAIAQSLKGIM